MWDKPTWCTCCIKLVFLSSVIRFVSFSMERQQILPSSIFDVLVTTCTIMLHRSSFEMPNIFVRFHPNFEFMDRYS
jgi:hypothetical protein